MNSIDTETLDRGELASLLARRDEKISVLTEFNRRMRGHFEIQTLLKAIMNYTKKILDSEACSILLVDQETDELYFYVTDDSGMNLDAIRLDKGQGVVGSVAESGECLIVNDTKSDSRFFSGVDDETGFVTHSLACVPMSIDDRIIGVVEVLNKIRSKYTDEDIATLDAIGSQAAVAIEYVRATEKRSMDARMAVVGNMAATVIHDLRNSMQVISGFSQLIAMQQPDQSENCEIIRSEIDKLVELSQELLEFSRGSNIRIAPEPVSLCEFLKKIYDLNHGLLEEGVDFKLIMHDDATLPLDTSKMQRVVQNLISNARDALVDSCDVTLEGGIMDGRPVILVTDSGKGMDEETMKNVFKPFFTKGKSGGTGLGMAIVENIVEGHDAQIQIESELGVGTTFRIQFPGSGDGA